MIEDRYLGDGVYASWDGWSVALDLRAQDSTTRILLEPEVMAALNEFVKTAMELDRCVLCDKRIGGYGHNPEPLASAPCRCCDTCNETKVVPARLKQAFNL